MDIVAIWTPERWVGCEHAVIRADDQQVVVDSVVVVYREVPVRLHYRLTCDPDWSTRRVELERWDLPRISLSRAADGTWSDDAGPRPDLAGCVDVDISVTPLTNTLPIRRLSLAPDEARDLSMVYVDVEADLRVATSMQRYTHLGPTDDGARYRYESGSYQAELLVDADGLVVDYAHLWQRSL